LLTILGGLRGFGLRHISRYRGRASDFKTDDLGKPDRAGGLRRAAVAHTGRTIMHGSRSG
jgi:hypothetical protein